MALRDFHLHMHLTQDWGSTKGGLRLPALLMPYWCLHVSSETKETYFEFFS